MISNIESMKQSVSPDGIDNAEYVHANKSIYILMFLYNPNLLKENKYHIMKYGIIQEQRDKSLCERLEDMFIDCFNLEQENNQKGAVWITLGNKR